MIPRPVRRLLRLTFSLPAILILLMILRGDAYLPQTTPDRVRLITAPYEFEFVAWTVDALWQKAGQFLLGEERYLSPAARHNVVRDYNRLIDDIHSLEAELDRIFADPDIADPLQASADLRADLAGKRRTQAGRQALVEAILQEQASAEIRREGFSLGGGVLPPLLFHFSQVPNALVVSPRETIRQDANIQLVPGLTLVEQIALEREVEGRMGVSALVVPLGGLGTFPTMITETSWINWVLEAVVHEWTHTYLFLTPLGLGYDSSPDLRTINESTASLVGKALGSRTIEDFYPELAPPPSAEPAPAQAESAPAPAPPEFDYVREMHTTRVETDRLLAEGRIAEAEAYMELRRQLFVEHGHDIRRINQAFFAFYGAYVDYPGERGNDPVGPAVETLFSQCPSVGSFLRAVSQVGSFAQLRDLIQAGTC
jgi:hypothetical protein